MSKSFEEEMEIVIDELLKILGKEFLTKIAILAKNIIYSRTKAGYGIDGGEKSKLEGLSPKYIDFRKKVFSSPWKPGSFADRIQKVGKGEFFSPTKSNATLTGQMLGSIAYEIRPDGVRLYIPNTVRKEGGKTNYQVLEFYSEQRPFFDLTQDERRILEREIENELRKIALRINRR